MLPELFITHGINGTLIKNPFTNEFIESLQRKVIHDYDKELSAEYEKSIFFKDINKYITKWHSPSQIKGNASRRLKTECEDYLVVDDVLFRIKIPRDKNVEPSLLFSNTSIMFLHLY